MSFGAGATVAYVSQQNERISSDAAEGGEKGDEILSAGPQRRDRSDPGLDWSGRTLSEDGELEWLLWVPVDRGEARGGEGERGDLLLEVPVVVVDRPQLNYQQAQIRWRGWSVSR